MLNRTTFGLLLGSLLVVGLFPATAQADIKADGKKLARAVSSQNSDAVQQALSSLHEAGGAEAVQQVLKQVQLTYRGGKQSIYWQLVNGAAGFRDASALGALGDFIVKYGKKGLRKVPFVRDLMFGMENNASPHTTKVLGRVLKEKKLYELQLMAADQLAQVHTTASVDILIEALKKEKKGDPQLRQRIVSALGEISGEDLGDALNWIDWWNANRDKGLNKVRKERDNAKKSGRFASSTMNRDRHKKFESLKKNPNRILVISSRLPKKLPKDDPDTPGRDYDLDHMEQILAGMEIPHKVVIKHDFEKNIDKYLREAWTILINCNYIQTQCVCKTCRELLGKKKDKGAKRNRLYGCPQECSVHLQKTYRLKEETIKKIKRWVEAGGYLFTEDWGIIEVIEVAWPNLVTSDFKVSPNAAGQPQRTLNLLPTQQVKITPGKGMTSRPILRGVFTHPRPPVVEKKGDDDDDDTFSRGRDLGPDPTKPPSHKWQIDDESPSILVKNPAGVDVLMRSEDLLDKTTGKGNDAVAISFRAGKGKPRGAKKKKKGRRVTGSKAKRKRGKSRGRGLWREYLPGGRVLHVLSHFGKQQGSQNDTFVLQNLILNFIMESNHQHGGE